MIRSCQLSTVLHAIASIFRAAVLLEFSNIQRHRFCRVTISLSSFIALPSSRAWTRSLKPFPLGKKSTSIVRLITNKLGFKKKSRILLGDSRTGGFIVCSDE